MILNKNKKELDDRLIRISKILNDTYRNKSSEEYKMRGDITKSSSYPNIEKMVAELSTLKGYSKSDASDINQLFSTLHRPIFKNMVREYMTEPNERNTIFCALFTLGYRLLVGELARIFTSTEATPKGIEYKPDKVSRRNDISKIIAIYKGDLEAKINAEIRTTSKASTKIEESYVEDVIAQMYIEEFLDEAFGETIYDESAKIKKDDMNQILGDYIKLISADPNKKVHNLKDLERMVEDRDTMPHQQHVRQVRPVDEPHIVRGEEGEISTATDPSYGTTDTDADASDSSNSVDSVQEAFGAALAGASAAAAAKAGTLMSAVSGVAKWATPVISGLGILAKILSKVTGFLADHNPIAEISHYFTRKYDKVVDNLDDATALYMATKAAYDEYMKIPESQRKKKVESRYIKNMEKYNIQMKNLEAKVEDFNSRAKSDASEPVPKPKQDTPSKSPNKSDSGDSDKPKNDDDFDF